MGIQIVLASVLWVLLGVACALAGDVTVAVAANVQDAFQKVKVEFFKATGIHIREVIASSGQLAGHIEHGAPFDVFLSADMDYPQSLKNKGLAYSDPRVYAYGTLVLWTMDHVDLSRGIEAVRDVAVRKIALPQPNTSPYGREAVNALRHYQLYEDVHKNIVYGESIAQTNQFIISKAAGLGFTSQSTVLAPSMKGQGQWIAIEKEAYGPIAQGIVILRHAKQGHLEESQKFMEFMLSHKGREILSQYGYALP